MRTPQVIVTKYYEIKDRKNIGPAPVWGWSISDGAAPGEPSVCANAIPGDYIVWHETFTENGRAVRKRPWAVVNARATRGGTVRVPIGCGAISRHATVEAAVAAAFAMLRADAKRAG